MIPPPASTAELFLDHAAVTTCKEWVRACHGGRGNRRALIITSPTSGMGISTLIRLVCEEEGAEPVVISHPIPKLKIFLADVAATAMTVEGRPKILVIDPLDAVLSEPTGTADLAEFCRAGTRLPIIVAGIRMRSSAAKLHECLRHRHYDKTLVTIPPIETSKALAFLRNAAASLGSRVPVESVWAGDIRNALAALRLGVTGAPKDVVCDGADAVRRALCDATLTIRDAIRMHEGDVSMVTSGTHENYPLTDQTIDTCSKLADTYSLADVMEEHTYLTQRWELGDVQVAVAVGGPVAYLDKAASQRAPALDLSKFGTIWSRNNNHRSKEKSFRAIRDVLIDRGLRGMAHIESIAILRRIIVNCMTTERWTLLSARLHRLPNETILSMMRLWKCGYTQVHHGQLKRKRTM